MVGPGCLCRGCGESEDEGLAQDRQAATPLLVFWNTCMLSLRGLEVLICGVWYREAGERSGERELDGSRMINMLMSGKVGGGTVLFL